MDRERVLRLLTFWLRPEFLLRCARRFSLVAGFDRSIALASTGFTALVPLVMLESSLLPGDAGDRLVRQLNLSGKGEEAARDALNGSPGVDTGLGLLGLLLLVVGALSFVRAAQRLFETTWQLDGLGVRNTKNGLWWLGSFILYALVSGFLRAQADTALQGLALTVLLSIPAGAFLVWTGWILTARRVDWQVLLPSGALAVPLLALYGIGAAIYVPRLFDTYASRFGAIGVSFALISALFAFMFVLVAAVIVGREVWEELQNIRQGIRPAQSEVDRQWADLRVQAEQARREARERSARATGFLADLRRRIRGGGPAQDAQPPPPEQPPE